MGLKDYNYYYFLYIKRNAVGIHASPPTAFLVCDALNHLFRRQYYRKNSFPFFALCCYFSAVQRNYSFGQRKTDTIAC